MVQIQLSLDDAEVLRQVVQNSLATLELEIQHTDHAEFKTLLKERRSVLKRLLSELPEPVPSGA
jgi:hypothetical protein